MRSSSRANAAALTFINRSLRCAQRLDCTTLYTNARRSHPAYAVAPPPSTAAASLRCVAASCSRAVASAACACCSSRRSDAFSCASAAASALTAGSLSPRTLRRVDSGVAVGGVRWAGGRGAAVVRGHRSSRPLRLCCPTDSLLHESYGARWLDGLLIERNERCATARSRGGGLLGGHARRCACTRTQPSVRVQRNNAPRVKPSMTPSWSRYARKRSFSTAGDCGSGAAAGAGGQVRCRLE